MTGNLLINPGMELWTTGPTACNGWYQYGGTLAKESSIVHSGSYSIKLTDVSGSPFMMYPLVGYFNRDIFYWRGKTIIFGCWVYATVANKAILHIQETPIDTASSYHTGDSTWQYLSITKKIGNDAVTVNLELHGVSLNTSIYFDDASLEEVQSNRTYVYGSDVGQGTLPCADNSSLGSSTWRGLQVLLNNSVESGSLSNSGVVSTYSLSGFGTSGDCKGAVLALNGDIHFVSNDSIGRKINSLGVLSTYSLVSNYYYIGGVLATNGDIHFVPYADRGQKISVHGVVSTYSLVYTQTWGSLDGAYVGGVVAPNGDIHFVPCSANRGQKVSAAGVVSTYSLVYTYMAAYNGGVLAPNGDIHFVPWNANRGQKISAAGVVSTYSLVYTAPVWGAYSSGVLAPNGDIHFIPNNAERGQKIDINGVVSTYSLVYTTSVAYTGGVLAPNGDIHFVPNAALVGQKVNATTGVVSTYTLVHTMTFAIQQQYLGGVLAQNGDIHFCPCANISTGIGQKISTAPAKPFSLAVCCHPYFNKF